MASKDPELSAIEAIANGFKADYDTRAAVEWKAIP